MSEEKRRSKRQSHPPSEEGWWDCSMCTYKNPPEFFKCEICECRKGTSTRKPRVTPQIAAQQVAQSVFTPPTVKKDKKDKKERRDKVDRLSTETATSDVTREDSVEADRDDSELPDLPGEQATPSSRMKKEPSPQVDTVSTTTSSTPACSKTKKEPSTSKERADKPHSTKSQRKPARLKNIDRSSGQSMEVTVNNVTVVITDYKPKKDKNSQHTSPVSSASSKANNVSHSQQAAAFSDRDGEESKDSVYSSHTDTMEGSESVGEVSSTVAET